MIDEKTAFLKMYSKFVVLINIVFVSWIKGFNCCHCGNRKLLTFSFSSEQLGQFKPTWHKAHLDEENLRLLK